MSNINGKVYAMNVITPMKPWKTFIVRVIFWLLPHSKTRMSELVDLSFIEFARWVIIPRDGFPFLGKGQEREDLHYDYLVFFSNFNGTWNQYIDAFSAVSEGLNLIWRWSEKFPGSGAGDAVQELHRADAGGYGLLLLGVSACYGERYFFGAYCAGVTG